MTPMTYTDLLVRLADLNRDIRTTEANITSLQLHLRHRQKERNRLVDQIEAMPEDSA